MQPGLKVELLTYNSAARLQPGRAGPGRGDPGLSAPGRDRDGRAADGHGRVPVHGAVGQVRGAADGRAGPATMATPTISPARCSGPRRSRSTTPRITATPRWTGCWPRRRARSIMTSGSQLYHADPEADRRRRAVDLHQLACCRSGRCARRCRATSSTRRRCSSIWTRCRSPSRPSARAIDPLPRQPRPAAPPGAAGRERGRVRRHALAAGRRRHAAARRQGDRGPVGPAARAARARSAGAGAVLAVPGRPGCRAISASASTPTGRR